MAAVAIHVRIRLFAIQRELAGAREVPVDLPEGATIEDAWSAVVGGHPVLAPGRPSVRFARNGDYSDPATVLADGDEVAFIPPVSGGGFRLSEEPLDLAAAVAEVQSDEAGAIAVFVGTTRARSRGRTVLHLDYEAYAGMAEQVMADLAAGLKSRYDLHEIAIHHRTGRVEIGGTSVVIAVSAPHRADALAACKDAIDTLKETVPLWKKEVYEGGEEWIGRGS
jgi:molybdopterin synthase catalytic subunit